MLPYLLITGHHFESAQSLLKKYHHTSWCMYKGLGVVSYHSELTCGDLVLEQNSQHLDQPSLFDKVTPTRCLQSVSSFPSAKEDEEELEENEVVLEDC